ncbi:saccharopine dehydrogenase NADP-binding domain-containing protein [Sulfuracidifex tepidarius]|nr:saccharopine dehydrogenase NADP-binding domain-containing protein [Sulfuracidifex tepidarius]
MKIAVLGGAGLIGRVISTELVKRGHTVTVMDLVKPEFNVGDFVKVDLKEVSETAERLKGFDFVVNSAQYYFNLDAMKASLKAGVNYVDLGGLFWMTRKQLEMDKDFEREGLLALIGMGAEPGVTNVMASKVKEMYGVPLEIHLRDGWKSSLENFNWSVDTQLDEATMDAPIWDGEMKFLPPFSVSEEVNFSIGKIKTYLTIHSELATFPYTFPGVTKVDWMEGGTGFECVLLLGKLFGKDRGVLKDALRRNGLIGYRGVTPDEVEAAKISFVYENRKVISEFVSFPRGEFDGTQFVTGISPVIALEMGLKGEGVLPPEKVISPDPFLDSLRREGIEVSFRTL